MSPGHPLRTAEHELGAVDLAAEPQAVAAAFGSLATLARDAEAAANDAAGRLDRVGEPGAGALAALVSATRADAERLAADFGQLQVTFRRCARAAGEGVFSTAAVREIVSTQLGAAVARYRALLAVLDRTDDVEARAHAYYARTLAGLVADRDQLRAEAAIDAAGAGSAVAMTLAELA